MVSVHTSPLQGIIVASEKRPPGRGQTQRSTASSLWVVFTSVISWYRGPVRTRMQDAGGRICRRRRSRPPAASLADPFLPSRLLLQVYVSYDYGRSFKRISEKLNFGEGNSSEAVIAQFYHSPADNKRVRMSPPVTV